MIGHYFDLVVATATYDKTNKKVYATVNNFVSFSKGGDALLAPFSKGGDVLAIINGSSFLAKVEAFETMGDAATVRLSFYGVSIDYLFNSGSEKPVLLKELSKSKELVKPFAIIDVAAVPTAAVLSALKERIALETLNFTQAFALTNLDTSSQVTVNFDAGIPNTMFETFFADKVKAKFSIKGLEILSERTRKGKVFTSDQPVKQVLLSDYLQIMRHDIREEDPLIRYTATVIDEKLNVVLNKKPIKEVLKFKNNGEIGYRFKFEDQLINWPTIFGIHTVFIEKLTVNNADYFDWSGSSGMSAPYLNSWQGLNQKGPVEVIYVKINNDDLALLELEILNSALGFGFICDSPLASFTVANQTLIGSLQLKG